MKIFTAIRERLNKATSGPWSLSDHTKGYQGIESIHRPGEWVVRPDDYYGSPMDSDADEDFIVHSPTDIALLLEAIDLLMPLLRCRCHPILEDCKGHEKWRCGGCKVKKQIEALSRRSEE